MKQMHRRKPLLQTKQQKRKIAKKSLHTLKYFIKMLDLPLNCQSKSGVMHNRNHVKMNTYSTFPINLHMQNNHISKIINSKLDHFLCKLLNMHTPCQKNVKISIR